MTKIELTDIPMEIITQIYHNMGIRKYALERAIDICKVTGCGDYESILETANHVETWLQSDGTK